MFGDLFEEETAGTTKGNSHGVKSGSQHGGPSLPCPPAVRLSCGLAGIDNRGATCYMNALLQTLLLTPEFRESLFALGPSELGALADVSKPGAKVRVIPIQLQRLFGRLLLLDQQSASTEELTDSFGWQNNEEFQQHDVQELNRILFSAVEDSLVGTSGQDLISQLYHGISVNKITCEECGRVSEREEDFLDLTLAVAHYSGMEDTLKTCYVDVERMEGRNQYRCSSCDKLVNAIKSAKLRSLPPILTVSLLRFSFDYQKCERYKETGRYTFPQEMDMSPYCEKVEPSENTVYELFSVLIHSGSTHGGHYHAYIKDIDGLGSWTTPEKEIILLPSRRLPSEPKVDLIELNSPQELLATLLRKHGGAACRMPVDKLCQALSEETGVSWNKRFKKKFGSITKFVKSHGELFFFEARTSSVCLKRSLQNLPLASAISELSLTDKAISRSDPCLATKYSDTFTSSTSQQHGELYDSQQTQNTIEGKNSRDGDRHPDTGRSRDGGSPAGRTVGGSGDKQSPCFQTDLGGDGRATESRTEEQEAQTLREDNSQKPPRADNLPKDAIVKEAGQGDKSEPDKSSKVVKPSQAAGQTLPSGQTAGGDCKPEIVQKEPNSKPSDSGISSKSESTMEPQEDRPTPSCHCQENQDKTQGKTKTHWFDFNDSRVMSIDESIDLPRQFSGRESAYMLFYRRKSMKRMKKAETDRNYGMPDWLVREIEEANKQLAKQREEYDKAINSIELSLLLSDHYEYRANALHRKPNADAGTTTLILDRRRSVADLKTEIVKTFGDSILNGVTVKNLCLHTAKELPAGLHLYNCVSEDDSVILQDVGLTSGMTLFLWDGHKIDGMSMKTGEACEPILVSLTYAVSRDNRETTEMSRGFAKDSTIGEMRAVISVETDIPLNMLKISRVLSEAVLIREEDDGKTVEEMGMKDGDRIIAEYKRKGKAPSLAANEAMRQSRLVFLTVENHCVTVPAGSEWPTMQVEIDKDVTVSELKACIISQLKQMDNWTSKTECRLRVNAYSAGLQPPLHESLKIAEVGIKTGTEVVIESGDPPKDNQINISFAVFSGETQLNHQEIIVDKNSTVQQTLELIVGLAGVTGNRWHLRKTNWFGEAAEFFQDPDATLHKENIQNGGFLLLAEGRLPPIGFVRLPIWLYPSPDRGTALPPTAQGEMVQWINSHIMNLISNKSTPADDSSASDNPKTTNYALLGNVELSQDAMLTDLKSQIQTLPAMSEVVLPSAGFMRLRLVEQGILGRVLRDGRQTLRRLKVTSASHIAVQILQEEENLHLSAIVLNICQRIPETRTYTSKEELIWDTFRSATPQSLRQVIADRLLLQSEQISIAKHLSQKFEWLVIQDQTAESKTGKGNDKKKGGRGGGGGGGGGGAKPKTNLKQPPYSLKDGDTIGVKDLRFDPLNQDDFSTEEDDAGKKMLEREAEEKRKRRQELRANNAAWANDGRRHGPKRPEVGLTIRVADFR